MFHISSQSPTIFIASSFQRSALQEQYYLKKKVWVYPVALNKAGKAVILQVNLSSSFASNAAPQKWQNTTKQAGMEFSGGFDGGYRKEN